MVTCFACDRANDWLTLDNSALLQRIADPRWELRTQSQQEENAPNLLPIREADGKIVGRCAMGTTLYEPDAGVVTVGGLRSIGLKQIAGLLTGRARRAARDLATPLVSHEALGQWASAQAALISRQKLDEQRRRAAAWSVYLCGGDPGNLPICQSAEGPLSFAKLVDWASQRDQVLVVGEHVLYQDLSEGAKLELAANTIASPINIASLFLQGPELSPWPLSDRPSQSEVSAAHPIHSALVTAWGCGSSVSRTSGKRTSSPRVPTKLNGQPVPTTNYQLYIKRYVDLDAPNSLDRPGTRIVGEC